LRWGCLILPSMVYRFGRFELDLATVELRADGELRPLQPQVFSLLALLVENRDRVVSKEEILEKVWDERIVSDSAIASRVKSARQALGDDGKSQRYIKTLHGHGFRFVADTELLRGARDGGENERAPDQTSQPSIAILPFTLIGCDGPNSTIADALPHELIADLCRLRWLLVTARGSSFRLREQKADRAEFGRLLGVRYCLSGAVQVSDSRLHVTVELIDTRSSVVVWADHFGGAVDDVHLIRSQIRAKVVVALDIHVPFHEANQARLKGTEHLDAWSAFHLGVQHIYRFNRKDNVAAAVLFQKALALDAGFARAHAGLSFVHFQNAFMRQTADLAGELDSARRFATRGVELDPLDPFVNFTMGRTFWLSGDLEGSLEWLKRATDISPNYAQGIYACAWSESLAGKAIEARKLVDFAMRLSPLDPLHYAMLGTRAFSHIALDEHADAANWAERAARAPGAHVLIALIAVAAHSLAENHSRATAWSENVRSRNPALTHRDFFNAFPWQSDRTKIQIVLALQRLGF
jgi:TolB-like protein